MNNLTPEQLAVLAKEDQGPLTRSIVISFTSLALIAVVLRIFTRLRYVGVQLGWEDYMIIFSSITSVITAIFQILQAQAGNGKHIMFIDPARMAHILKYLFWSIIFYGISLTCTKLSILLQYRRVFNVQKMRIPLYIAMGICTTLGTLIILLGLFTCEPSAPGEKPKSVVSTSGNCIPTFPLVLNFLSSMTWIASAKCIWYTNAGLNIFTDLMVAFLPVKVIWQLQISRRPKIALIGIMTIGWFVCVVSILRLHSLTVLEAKSYDPTYYSAAAAYWSSIEMNLAIVCASLPALKPLVVRIMPGFSSRGGSNGYALGTDGHGKVISTSHGVRSTARRADMDDIELSASGSPGYPKKSSGDSILGKNIYVSRHFEQHYDDNSRNSDSESQKDLVERH